MSGYVYGYDNIVLAEMNRNHAGHGIFKRFLQRAFGDGVVVVINHHIVYETKHEGKRDTQEIPSADTLLFSPFYMDRVFGKQAEPIMRALLMCPPQEREAHLARELEQLEAFEILQRQRAATRRPLSLQSKGAIVDVGGSITDESEHIANKV